MTKRLIPGIGKIREPVSVLERDDLKGSGSRGLHQGQQSRRLRTKAGHMTAPTNIAVTSKKHLARRGPSTHDWLFLYQAN